MTAHLLSFWSNKILAAAASTITDEDIKSAFFRGAGVGHRDVSGLIAGVALVAVLLWATWIIASDYQAFARGEVSFYDFIWHMVRAAVVAIIFSILVNPD